MNEDRVAGTTKSLGGKVEEGFGRVTGGEKTQIEGLMKRQQGPSRISTVSRRILARMPLRWRVTVPLRLKIIFLASSNSVHTPRLSPRFVSAGSSVAWDGVESSAHLIRVSLELSHVEPVACYHLSGDPARVRGAKCCGASNDEIGRRRQQNRGWWHDRR
jgi:hypothetical protein